MAKRKKVTPAAARKAFNAYETSVFNPVQEWLRERDLPAGVYDELPQDLAMELETLHELLRQIVQAAEQEG